MPDVVHFNNGLHGWGYSEEGSIWGNPYLRVLRSQIEACIAEQRGKGWLASAKDQTELRKIKKEIAALKKTLSGLESRKAELEQSLHSRASEAKAREAP